MAIIIAIHGTHLMIWIYHANTIVMGIVQILHEFLWLQESLSSVSQLIKKHKNFENTLEAQQDKIETLQQLSQALLSQDHYAKDQIVTRKDVVLERHEKVRHATENRKKKLEDSKNYQQFLQNLFEVLLYYKFICYNNANIYYCLSKCKVEYFCTMNHCLSAVRALFPFIIWLSGNRIAVIGLASKLPSDLLTKMLIE